MYLIAPSYTAKIYSEDATTYKCLKITDTSNEFVIGILNNITRRKARIIKIDNTNMYLHFHTFGRVYNQYFFKSSP